MQVVAPAVVAGHPHVVHHRAKGKAAEGHLKAHAGVGEPAFRGDPGVLFFLLLIVFQLLVKQALVIVQTSAVAAEVQGGDGVQKTGSQTAQTAVAQRGLVLGFLDEGELSAVAGQQFLCLVEQAQIDEIVAEQLADEKLRRHIIQLALALGGGHGGHLLLGVEHQGGVDLLVGGAVQIFAVMLFQNALQSLFHILFPLISLGVSVGGAPGRDIPAAAPLRSRPGQSSPGKRALP